MRYAPSGASNFRHRALITPSHHRLEKWAVSLELIPSRVNIHHSPDFIPPVFGASKRVITVHDLNFLHYPQFLTAESRRYYAGQIDWAVQVADHIIADSHHTRKDLINRLNTPPEKVTTIYLAANPIYEKDWPADQSRKTLERLRLPKEFVLFVGTLSPRKNIATLVKANAHLVKHANFDLPLVLAGARGWKFDGIFNEIYDLGLQDKVMHYDSLTDTELAHLYSFASLLALPSFYEGFGLPPLEAMHRGCPVITSDRSSLPEVVGDAGVLLDPDDVEAWAEAMLKVVDDQELRAQMIERGYRQARSFSWERTAAETLRIYRELNLNE
jgi:glycosyltransferase involved in cell wall biosynthesis